MYAYITYVVVTDYSMQGFAKLLDASVSDSALNWPIVLA